MSLNILSILLSLMFAPHRPLVASQAGFSYSVWKIEATQGIQLLDWQPPCVAFGPAVLPDPNCADNAIPLVERKTTALRVFVQGLGRAPADFTHVQGTLTLSDPNGGTQMIVASNNGETSANLKG